MPKGNGRDAGQHWLATYLTPCEFCHLSRHKHPMHCPNYHALDNARCAVQHAWFYRASGPDGRGNRWNEFECSLCSIPSRFAMVDVPFVPHPWCAEGRHFWIDPCYCGCQGSEPFCYCGAKGTLEQYREQRETYEKPKS